MLIFLIGYMGCGKSSVGKALAREMAYDFADMDLEIEQDEGMTPNEIFAAKGEAHFRQLERKKLESYFGRERLIVSTGGGVACFGDNMELMNRYGVTVFLDLPEGVLISRLEHGKHKRPLLREKSPEELAAFVRESLAKRRPYYQQALLRIQGLDIKAHDVAELLQCEGKRIKK